MTAHAVLATHAAQVNGYSSPLLALPLHSMTRPQQHAREGVPSVQQADMPPLILCGDFNFTPCSFQYACITSGKYALDYSSPHLNQHKKEMIAGWRAPALYPMASLYRAVHGAEPAFTNNCIQRMHQGGENAFCDTLDYIFASGGVRALCARPLPADGPRLPNQRHPSDHLPVLCDVEIE
jgi:endonuclease/exonuclease/phosphatase family metal-dependent hydrolase